MSIFQISAVMDSSGNQLDTQYSNVRPFVLRLVRLLIVMREREGERERARERFVLCKVCPYLYLCIIYSLGQGQIRRAGNKDHSTECMYITQLIHLTSTIAIFYRGNFHKIMGHIC